MMKLVFLFLTINGIHHENYWRDFFEAAPKDSYSIYVHPKYSIPEGSFFKPYEMKTRSATTWSNTMRAQIAMLKEALKDPNNTKFIFLSEKTIPLQDFDYVYKEHMSHAKSMFYFRPNTHSNRNTHGYHPEKHRNLLPIAPEHQYKNYQWIVLNRKHAQMMVNDTEIIDIALRYGSDQEHYPSTFLAVKGCLMDEVLPVDTTEVIWDIGEQPPYEFTDLLKAQDMELLQRAIEYGFSFIRKVHPDCDLTLLDNHLSYRRRAQTKSANVKWSQDEVRDEREPAAFVRPGRPVRSGDDVALVEKEEGHSIEFADTAAVLKRLNAGETI